MLGRAYRKRIRKPQTWWIGNILQKKKNNATNTSRVYRKRRRMLQTCWLGYIGKEKKKNVANNKLLANAGTEKEE